MPVPSPLHVAVAVIKNPYGKVLLAQRPAHVHQGGLWEFPGGKVEPGEIVRAALDRELLEELGITATSARPLMRVHHDYADKSVLLDVWQVTEICGTPHGREGQLVRWVALSDLRSYSFPQANLPIVNATLLPSIYLITNELSAGERQFIERLERALRAGVRLVQLRAKSLDNAHYRALAVTVISICRAHGAQLLLNCEPQLARELNAHGLHLSSARLLALQKRPLPEEFWVGASIHNLIELQHAQKIGVDFIVVAPVLPTTTHPGAPGLGWDAVRELTEAAAVPVFALGGMRAEHMATAYTHGAQGLAVMSAIMDAADIEASVREFMSVASYGE